MRKIFPYVNEVEPMFTDEEIDDYTGASNLVEVILNMPLFHEGEWRKEGDTIIITADALERVKSVVE